MPKFDTVAADKIPRDAVAALAQDTQGFLWIATGDGLARFDGLSLQPQPLSAGPRTVERNLGWVRTLLGARDGRVWIGTETRGLAVYDPHDEQIRLLEPDVRAQPTVFALAEGRDGSVWAGSLGGGLRHFDPEGRSLEVWRADARTGSLPDNRVQSLLVDRDGSLWVGSWGGLSRQRGNRFEAVGPELAGQTVQALHQTRDGALWAGTASGDLLRIGPQGQRLHLAAGPAGAITALAEPEPGVLWVGHELGIELRDASTGQLWHWLRHQPLAPRGLAGDAITTLLTDASGVLWVAGLGVGLQRRDPSPGALQVRGAELDPSSPLANANVQAVLARRDGSVWVATDSSRLAVLNAQLQVVGVGPQAGARVRSMAEMPDASVWLGLEGRLLEWDAQGRRRRELKHEGGAAQGLLAGRDGQLWLAASDGLWRLDAGASRLRRVDRRGGRPLRGEVHALSEAPDGSLWVASSEGLLVMAPGEQQLDPVRSPPGEGLGSPIVIGLLFDRQGQLWLDTAVSGLHRLRDWQGGLARFDRVSERLGDAGQPFGANLLDDEQGRIWTQMRVYDPAADRITRLGAADGVRIGMPWFHAYARTQDGRLLFGGTRGLLEVRAQDWQPVAARPSLRFAHLQLDGRPQPVLPALQGLVLPPGTQRLLVDIGMLDTLDASQQTYEFRVDGLDRDWQTSFPGQRQISLLPLLPGDYRLRVRAGAGAPELLLPLQMQPAWWQTAWARSGAVLAVLAGFALLLRWRTRQLVAQQRMLEQRVQERTQALEDASLTDPLTGLRNRRYLQARIEADCAHARRHAGEGDGDSDLVFFLVDLDHFKGLNDSHGHAAGDAVLSQMRARLQSVFRASDAIVRWGGEEFLVAARDTRRSHAAGLAERLRLNVADLPFDTPAGPLHVTCSIGFAAYPLMPLRPDAFSWSEVLGAADATLYQGKRDGRNCWQGVERLDGVDEAAARLALAAGGALMLRRRGPSGPSDPSDPSDSSGLSGAAATSASSP